MLSILREAGWPIWPLLATSVLGLALIFERFLSLRRSLILPRGLNEQVADMLRNHQDTPKRSTGWNATRRWAASWRK